MLEYLQLFSYAQANIAVDLLIISVFTSLLVDVKITILWMHACSYRSILNISFSTVYNRDMSQPGLATCAEAGLFLGSHWSRSLMRWMASVLALGVRLLRLLGTH